MKLELELYVLGMSARSEAAVENLRVICREMPNGECAVRVIDVLEQPERAEEANVIATPTLIRRAPLPVRRVVGDLSQHEAVRQWLDVARHDENEANGSEGR